MKEERKEMVYLTTHSTRFHLRLYGVGFMAKGRVYSERGNPLPPLHGLILSDYQQVKDYKCRKNVKDIN